jgi:Protein of unknown function (DUF2796)
MLPTRGARVFGLVFLALSFASASLALSQHRELGKHQHGHGTLNIAIEGVRVSMELDVPAADIVGFEHAATSTAQRTAIENAKHQLSAPLSLFSMPAGAGCSIKEANVKIEGAEETKGAAAVKAKPSGAEQHSDFNADYALECTSIDKLTFIEFPYFKTYPRAEALEVNLVTAKGQSKFEVTRNKPRIDLAGMM